MKTHWCGKFAPLSVVPLFFVGVRSVFKGRHARDQVALGQPAMET
jgi:hypothetical protein